MYCILKSNYITNMCVCTDRKYFLDSNNFIWRIYGIYWTCLSGTTPNLKYKKQQFWIHLYLNIVIFSLQCLKWLGLHFKLRFRFLLSSCKSVQPSILTVSNIPIVYQYPFSLYYTYTLKLRLGYRHFQSFHLCIPISSILFVYLKESRNICTERMLRLNILSWVWRTLFAELDYTCADERDKLRNIHLRWRVRQVKKHPLKLMHVHPLLSQFLLDLSNFI